MTMQEFLAALKPLTLTQYDQAKTAALARVKPLIGEKPDRKMVARDQGKLLTPLDWLALVVFIAALVISSVHIIHHAGKLAQTACKATTETIPGISIAPDTCVKFHQGGFIFLSEASMLLFMVSWRVGKPKEPVRKRVPILGLEIDTHLFSVPLALALLAMSFVLLANVSSGLTLLEAVMPPIFTIGIGFHVEHIITETIRREAELMTKLRHRLAIWEAADDDPTSHPAYRQLLLREIWEMLIKVKENRELIDVPGTFKYAAVQRELLRDGWAAEEVQVEQAAAATGQSVAQVSEAQGLPQLITMIKGIPVGAKGAAAIIDLPAFSVNLVELTWLDKAQAKTFGPYKNRENLLWALKRRVAAERK